MIDSYFTFVSLNTLKYFPNYTKDLGGGAFSTVFMIYLSPGY